MSREATLAQTFAEVDAALRVEAIRAMAAHRATRKFLWWLLAEGKALGHNPFAPDPLLMAKECGEMAVGQAVLQEIIGADPEILITLMREHEDERRNRDADLRDARERDARDDAGPYDYRSAEYNGG